MATTANDRSTKATDAFLAILNGFSPEDILDGLGDDTREEFEAHRSRHTYVPPHADRNWAFDVARYT